MSEPQKSNISLQQLTSDKPTGQVAPNQPKSGKPLTQLAHQPFNVLAVKNDKTLFEYKGTYHVRFESGDDAKEITNFEFDRVRFVTDVDTGEQSYLVDVVFHEKDGSKTRKEDIRLRAEDLTSATQIEKALKVVRATVTAYGDTLALLKEALFGMVHSQMKSSSVLGWHDNGFLLKQGFLTKDGLQTQGYLLTDKRTDTHQDMYRFPMPTREQWKEVSRAFMTKMVLLNNKQKMLTLVGWFLAAPLKKYLSKHDLQLGILNVYGTKESGKTSTLLLLQRFFGYIMTRGISTSKMFTLMKKISMFNANAVWYDEFREAKNEASLLKELARATYDGATEYRGQGDLSSEVYELIAPFIISGEDQPNDPATNDRLCSVHLKPHEKQEAPYIELERTPDKEHFFLGYIQWLLQNQDKMDELRTHAQEEVQKLNAFESIRAEKTAICVMFGLLIGLELTKELNIEPSYTVQEAKDTVKELALTIERKRPQDILVAMMYELREHREDILKNGNFVIKQENGQLIGYFKQSTILKHLSRSVLKGSISEDSIKNRIRENIEAKGFILNESRQTSINGKNVRCLVVNLDKLCELHPEEFQLSDWKEEQPLNVNITDKRREEKSNN